MENLFSLINFEILGKLVVVFFLIIAALLLLILLIVYYTIKTGKILFPNLLLLLIDAFYTPLTILTSFLGLKEDLIDRIAVELRNAINYRDFENTSLKDRIVLAPQCMRALECRAVLDPKNGFRCRECGGCRLSTLVSICREVGVEIFIIPGGSFAKRILISKRPKAVLGIGCFPELYEGMLNAKIAGIPSQGVPLTHAGCVGTDVDLDEVLRRLFMGTEVVCPSME
ncbi:MAG: DUF116 domain-containing protein [Candidatus Syntropharchaeia archaeon]